MDPLTEPTLKQPLPRPELKLWDILHRLGFLCEDLEQALLNEKIFTVSIIFLQWQYVPFTYEGTNKSVDIKSVRLLPKVAFINYYTKLYPILTTLSKVLLMLSNR